MTDSRNGDSVAIDVRGLVCPEPVVRTRAAIEANPGKAVRVTTDSAEARDNVARFARSRGHEVSSREAESGTWIVEIRPGAHVQPPAARSGRVVLIASEQFGSGAEELGRLLMQLLLRSLSEVSGRPAAIVLVHGGVRLAVDGSPVLDSLQQLERLGVTIRVCGTCLDYFGLKGQVRVGQVSNMYEAAELLLAADGVVRI
jgi:selenium metabolism protein YedF